MSTYHTDMRLQLLAQGYAIIPNRGKVPAMVGWNEPDYVAKQLTDNAKGTAAQRVARWEARFSDAVSTGVRIENGLGVVDGDIDDGEMVGELFGKIDTIAPEVARAAPARYGGGTHKFALFCQVEGERWVRIASRRYNGHCVEIFGGAPLRSGRCSRQFGIYGPHSFSEDGSVARSYEWGIDAPELADMAQAELPKLTKAQAYAIVAAFEQLAQEAGWEAEARPVTEGASAVYDIDETTRFDTSLGHSQIDYAELSDLQEMHTDLRCASNFMVGRDGTDRSRCWVFHSPRHDCTAVYVYGDEQTHYPVAHKPLETEDLADRLTEAGIEMEPAPPQWRETYPNGSPRASLHNARLGIEAGGFAAVHDVFHNKMYLGRPAGGPLPAFCGEVTDNRIGLLRVWISDRYGRDFTEKHVRDAVATMAIANPYNPVTDMLAEAQANWDGVERLDRMAVDYFGCPDTPLNRACVAKTMIAAVARARNPGIKFDTILVLESPEGWNKSSAWAILAGEGNFSDERIIGRDSREVVEQLAGIWIHENAELAGMKKAEVEAVKAYASRAVDRARPAYGHFLVEQPRHSIEIGTTNSDRYLQSQTGNRRFWPIRMERRIDLAALKAARLQLWGEAATRQAAGESLVLDEALWGAAAIEQEARRVAHPWEAVLARMSVIPETIGYSAGAGLFVIHRVGDEDRVASADIFTKVLEIPGGQMNRGHSMAVSEIMRLLGWEQKLIRIGGIPLRGYVRPVGYEVGGGI